MIGRSGDDFFNLPGIGYYTTVAYRPAMMLCTADDLRHTIQCSYCKSKFVMRETVLQKCPNCGGTFDE